MVDEKKRDLAHITKDLRGLVRQVARLRPDPDNVRLHDERNLEAIRASLEAHGQQKPIVLKPDGKTVAAGSGTLLAARALGWKWIAAIRYDRDPDGVAAFAVTDNRSAELATWDEKALVAVFKHYDDVEDGRAKLPGWTAADVSALYAADKSETTEDAAPPPPANPVSVAGGIYELGPHVVMCGDARDKDHVAQLIGDPINVAITSPPYASQRKYDESSAFTPVPPDKYVEWFDAVQRIVADHLAADGSWLVNIKEHCEDGVRHLYVKDLTIAHTRLWKWRFVEEYCWTHSGTPKAVVNRFKNGWEPIFHFTKGDHKFRPDHVQHRTLAPPNLSSVVKSEGRHPSQQDGRGLQAVIRRGSGTISKLQGVPGGGTAIGVAVKAKLEDLSYPSNVLSFGRNLDALGHGAAFPVSLPEFFINAYSDRDDVIYDPFAGAGATLIAAESTQRTCRAMEISPVYCDVIRQRYANFVKDAAYSPTGTLDA